jgi:hypothetical protein
MYPDGYHMLTRYSDCAKVIFDVAVWLRSPQSALPSGYESSLDGARTMVCAKA